MKSRLISKTDDQKSEWDSIWERDTVFSRLISFGRGLYNPYFIRFLSRYIDVDSYCELGCGTSTLLLKIAKKVKNCAGIDYSPESIRISKGLAKKLDIDNVKFYKDDARNIKIKQRFDVVWSQGLIEHFEKPEIVIKEHLKITKDGGRSLISVPYKYSYALVWYVLTRPKFLRWFWPWTGQVFYTKKMFHKIMNILKKDGVKYKYYKLHVLKPWILGNLILEIKK